jgi:hypothetical protein
VCCKIVDVLPGLASSIVGSDCPLATDARLDFASSSEEGRVSLNWPTLRLVQIGIEICDYNKKMHRSKQASSAAYAE